MPSQKSLSLAVTNLTQRCARRDFLSSNKHTHKNDNDPSYRPVLLHLLARRNKNPLKI